MIYYEHYLFLKNMIVDNPHSKLIDEFISNLTKDKINMFILKYIINHTFFNTKTVAKDIIYREFGYDRCKGGSNQYITSLTRKLWRFIADLKEYGIIVKHSSTQYKVVRDRDSGYYEGIIRSNGCSSLYLTIPAEFARKYSLEKDDRVINNIEIIS